MKTKLVPWPVMAALSRVLMPGVTSRTWMVSKPAWKTSHATQ